MLKSLFLALALILATPALAGTAEAAPPSIADLQRSIELYRKTIGEHEATLHEYNDETRKTVGNDPASIKRREELRIIKRYYQQEIESLNERIKEDYKRIQEMRQGAGS